MNDNTLIPETIRKQIGVGVFMSLGASDLMADRVWVKKPRYDTLAFKARILDPNRRKRVMQVRVVLDPMDTYTVKVTYAKAGDPSNIITHFEQSDVYADQLGHVLLKLDQVI